MTFEGERSHEHSIEQYPQRPHVDLPAIVLLFPDELGRHVGRRAAEYFLFLAILAKSCEAKIYYLDHVCVVFYQHVVELDISVSNAFVMQIIKSFSDLLEEAAADALLHLAIRALLFDVLVQRYAFNVIGHEANLLTCFNYVVHSDYVRVINFLQGKDLALHSLPLHAIIQFNFLINFDGTLLHGLLMVASVDACVGALADGLADLIILKLSEADMSRLVERILLRAAVVWRPVQQCRVLGGFHPVLLACTYNLRCIIVHIWLLLVPVILDSYDIQRVV